MIKKQLSISLGFDLHSLEFHHRHHSDLVILPELVSGGYAPLWKGAPPFRIDDPLLQELRQNTRQTSQYLVPGSLFLENAGIRTNSSIVLHRGRMVYRYDKIHLFRPTGDHIFFSSGKRIGVFTVRTQTVRVRAGIAICYDLRFPELIRAMRLRGMHLLLVPARWPIARDDAWFTLLKARAIENQIFVVGCNAKGKEGGYSYAFDPTGRLIYDNRRTLNKRIDTVALDLSKLDEAKQLQDPLKEARLLGRF